MAVISDDGIIPEVIELVYGDPISNTYKLLRDKKTQVTQAFDAKIKVGMRMMKVLMTMKKMMIIIGQKKRKNGMIRNVKMIPMVLKVRLGKVLMALITYRSFNQVMTLEKVLIVIVRLKSRSTIEGRAQGQVFSKFKIVGKLNFTRALNFLRSRNLEKL